MGPTPTPTSAPTPTPTMGPTPTPTWSPTPTPTMGPTPTPTSAPTPTPTMGPTPTPTSFPTPTPTTVPTPSLASAKGDPRFQNLHGEKFDLMKPGNVTLIQIPRGAAVSGSELVVEACAEIFFQTLSIMGNWAKSGVHYDARVLRDEIPRWSKFGPIELKVAHGRTENGLGYLNFYVKHLGRVRAAIGGLLGEDDHNEEATPEAKCRHKAALSRRISMASP